MSMSNRIFSSAGALYFVVLLGFTDAWDCLRGTRPARIPTRTEDVTPTFFCLEADGYRQ